MNIFLNEIYFFNLLKKKFMKKVVYLSNELFSTFVRVFLFLDVL